MDSHKLEIKNEEAEIIDLTEIKSDSEEPQVSSEKDELMSTSKENEPDQKEPHQKTPPFKRCHVQVEIPSVSRAPLIKEIDSSEDEYEGPEADELSDSSSSSGDEQNDKDPDYQVVETSPKSSASKARINCSKQKQPSGTGRWNINPTSRDVKESQEKGLQLMIGINQLTRDLYGSMVAAHEREKKIRKKENMNFKQARFTSRDADELCPAQNVFGLMGVQPEARPTSGSEPEGNDDQQLFREIIRGLRAEDKASSRPDRERIDTASQNFNRKLQSVGPGKWRMEGMKTTLMDHQVEVISWMLEQEKRRRHPGGLLAHAMGFGKTMDVLALILNGISNNPTEKQAPTLIVAPKTILEEWKRQLDQHCDPKALGSFEHYDRSEKPENSKVLLEKMKGIRVVLASYELVRDSYPALLSAEVRKNLNPSLITDLWLENYGKNVGFLHRVKWHRIVLDEGQQIRNHRTKQSVAVRALAGKIRWVLSGKPVLESKSSIPSSTFLGSPQPWCFKDFYTIYARWKNKNSKTRLMSILRRFIHQRTYQDTLFGKPIIQLPPIEVRTMQVEFSHAENLIYQTVAEFLDDKSQIAKSPQAMFLKYLTCARMLSSHTVTARIVVKETMDKNPALLKQLQSMADSEQTESKDERSRLIAQLLLKAYYMDEHMNKILEMQDNNPKIRDLLSGNKVELLKAFGTTMDQLLSEEDQKGLEWRKSCLHCGTLPSQAFITSCSHVYCHACFLDVLVKCDKNRQYEPYCSACRRSFTSATYCDRLDAINRVPDEFFASHSTAESLKKRKQDPEDPVPGRAKKKKKDLKGGTSSPDKDFKNEYYDNATKHWIARVGCDMPTTKLTAAHDLIQDWLKKDETSKIVVFTNFRGTINILRLMCERNEWPCAELHGNMTIESRNSHIEAFQTDSKIKVMLTTQHTGGIGISLTAGNKCILMDPWWNKAVDSQATHRIYRIGQERAMEAVLLWGNCSIDQKIEGIQKKKEIAIDQVSSQKVFKGKFNAIDAFLAWGKNQLDDGQIEELMMMEN